MNILHVDTNHPLLIEQLEALGHYNVVDIFNHFTESHRIFCACNDEDDDNDDDNDDVKGSGQRKD